MTEDYNKYYEQRTHKENWWKILGIILATLLGAFLAFYFAVDMALNRMMDPTYSMKRMEKMVKHQEKYMKHLEHRYVDNPFEPRLAPMLVNLVKEPKEYKVIVDLKPIGGDEKNVNVKLTENIITISGDMEKKERNRENIVNFAQSYYLDEKIEPNKISKEKKGNKYIITIPFVD